MTTAAHARDLADRLRTHEEGASAWKSADGKCTCALRLVLPTVAQPDMTAERIARSLTEQAATARACADVIAALAARDWAVSQPEVVADDGFQDVMIVIRKRFATDEQAGDEARAAGAALDF